jgi:isopentenyl-diphosphate Delta-isomerase
MSELSAKQKGGHPDELLDVVDEDNRVMRQAPRREVHVNGDLHRSIHLFLVNDRREILLQKRSQWKPDWPGCWDSSVSGHVTAGQTYDETVFREAEEEIDYRCSDPAPVLLIEGSELTGREWVQLYVEKPSKRPRLRPDPAEVSELRWWGWDELVEALVREPDSFARAFRTLFFMWRQTEYVIPEKDRTGWYRLYSEVPDRLQILRSFLESAGLAASVERDQHWLGHAGHGMFGQRNPMESDLCVPREHLSECIALLYLSEVQED